MALESGLSGTVSTWFRVSVIGFGERSGVIAHSGACCLPTRSPRLPHGVHTEKTSERMPYSKFRRRGEIELKFPLIEKSSPRPKSSLRRIPSWGRDGEMSVEREILRWRPALPRESLTLLKTRCYTRRVRGLRSATVAWVSLMSQCTCARLACGLRAPGGTRSNTDDGESIAHRPTVLCVSNENGVPT